MTLKGIHIIFIVASDILSLFFALWAYKQYANTQALGYLTTAIVSIILAVGLIIYGIQFYKKVKV